MSLDVEMRRSNSPIADHELDIDPAVVSSVRPGPEKAVFNFKESERHPGDPRCPGAFSDLELSGGISEE
jgi:hypothetical protein